MLGPDDFAGRWVLQRQIDDRFGGQTGEMSGEAVFSADADGLIYRETGQMRLGTGPLMTAQRRYLWRFGDDVEVLFDDGRPFHRFAAKGNGAGTDHPCGDDIYRVAYDFTAWPVWSAVWAVIGPRKDYTSQSRYLRA